jgi:hypothetical protein
MTIRLKSEAIPSPQLSLRGPLGRSNPKASTAGRPGPPAVSWGFPRRGVYPELAEGLLAMTTIVVIASPVRGDAIPKLQVGGYFGPPGLAMKRI